MPLPLENCWQDLLPDASPFATMQVICVRTVRVETTVHIDVDGDIKDIWIVVERFLNAVTWVAAC